MRPLLAVVLILAAAGVTAAPVPKSIKKEDDKSALVGTWKVISMSAHGGKESTSTNTFIIDAEGGVWSPQGGANGGVSWTWTIDPTTTPRTMEWVSNSPSRKVWSCIYELNGDTLKVGFLVTRAKLPTSVGPDGGVVLYTMTRDTSTN